MNILTSSVDAVSMKYFLQKNCEVWQVILVIRCVYGVSGELAAQSLAAISIVSLAP